MKSTRVRLAIAMFAALPGLYAQTPATQPPADQAPAKRSGTSSSRRESRAFTDRISFGGRISYVPFGLLEKKATSAPITDANIRDSKKLGAGATVEFGITRRFGVTVDAIYRRIGYGMTQTSGDNLLLDDRSRGTYWDFPLMLRYNHFGSTGFGSHLFVDAGVVLRKLYNGRTTRDTYDTEGNVTTTEFDTTAHHSVRGAVVGAGLRFRDDFGLKLTPEVRYTRWMANIYGTSPILSKRDQVEVIIGITF